MEEWSESLPKKPEPETAEGAEQDLGETSAGPLSPPPHVGSADLPPSPQAPPTRGYVPPVTTTSQRRRSLGFWALLGAGGCLILVVLLVGAVGLLAAFGGGSGQVAEKPKQERQVAQQEQPQKKEPQPQKEEQQAQGGQKEWQDGGEQEPEPRKPEPQEPSFGDGAYQVGTDIQPGTYRTREGSPNCYWERLKNFSGGINGILANGGTGAPAIVTIEPTDAGFNSEGCGTWTKDLAAITASKTSFGAGAYIVGTDIEPGTYRNSGGNNCYWERLRGFSGGINGIIANGGTSNPSIVTIAPTDAGFQSDGCGTWTKLE